MSTEQQDTMHTSDTSHKVAAGASPKPRIVVSGAPVARPNKTEEELKAEAVSKDAKDKASARKGAIFLAIIFAINLLFIVFSGQLDEFVTSLQDAQYSWIIAGFLCMVGYVICGAGAFMMAAFIDPACPLGVRDCISIEASGVTFGNLTPMSSGAIPAQIFRIMQAGLDAGEATAMQLTRFVCWQTTEVLIAAIALLLEFHYFEALIGDIVFINVVVFFVQSCQVTILVLLCLFPRSVSRVAHWLLRFAYRRTWINSQKYTDLTSMLDTQVAQFGGAFHAAISHRGSVILTVLITFVQIIFFYSVPWFVLHAFGMDASYLVCLAGAAMVQMIGNSVPLPGGAGGIEAGFVIFFGPIFGTAAAAGFIVWRLITFYLPTVFCLPLTALRSKRQYSLYERFNAIKEKRPLQPLSAAVAQPKRKTGRKARALTYKFPAKPKPSQEK